MRQLSGILCCTALVVAMTAACGSAPTPTSQSQPPTSQSEPAVFPLTITRTGGIAGFRDVLVVAGDGLVSVTHKGKAPRQCRLTAEAVQQLTTAASQVPWSRHTPTSTQPSFPDDLVTMVLSPAGGSVRLADPQTGARDQIFHELLTDLNSDPAASRMCRPV